MYTLLIAARVKPGQNHEFVNAWSRHILPLYKRQSGLLEVTLLFEEGTAAVSALSIWRTPSNREQYRRDVFPQARGSVEHLLSSPPAAHAIDVIAAYTSPNLQRFWRGTKELEQSPRKKVFVVDDDKQIADALTVVLREAKFEVETFYDAHSALLRASDYLPDILVSDIDMPEMNGVALAGALQRQNPDCKVILISGNPDSKAHGNLQVSTIDGFTLLPKPFSTSQLLHLIKSE